MTTATLTSPRHQELVNILTAAGKPLTSKQLFAQAKGFESQDDISKCLNYLLKKGVVERELYAQNAYSYWPATPANATDDSGNTLLRVGEDEPMPEISAATAKQIANDAINLPDAVTIEMANQAEQAYQVLSEALGLTPEQMSELTLADVEAIAAELITQRERASSQTELLGKICHTLDLSLYSTAAEILSEVENISRLTDRAIQIGARDATQGPYIIISDPRGAAGIYETIEDARPHAESTARRSTFGRAAIVTIVAEVAMVPQWSDEA